MDWKAEAKRLFYLEGKKIVEIAELLEKNKATISKFLSSDDPAAYNEAKNKRKIGVDESKRRWKREADSRKKNDPEREFEKELLRSQHEQDVMLMSTRSSGNVFGMWESGYIRAAYDQKGSCLVRRERTKCGAAVPSRGLPKYIQRNIL